MKDDAESARTSVLWFQPQSTSEEVNSQISLMRDSLQRDGAKTNLLVQFVKSLRKRSYLKPIILGLILFVIEVGSGRPLVAAYVFEIFRDLHSPYDNAFLGDGYGVFGIMGALAALVLVYILSRKMMFYLSSIITIFSLAITIGYQFYILSTGYRPFPWIPVLGLYVYSMMVSGPFSTSITVIPSEIQHPRFRGPAMTLFMFSQFCTAFLIDKMFPYAEVMASIQYVFIFFMINIIVGIIIVWLFIPETSNKEFYEK